RRSHEIRYDKFNDNRRHTCDVFHALLNLADDVRVYILSLTEESESGQIKMKTDGKLLDDKISLEGLVTL
ncbi:ATP-binding protein, partial [Pseudomonas syringae pv. tagetis]